MFRLAVSTSILVCAGCGSRVAQPVFRVANLEIVTIEAFVYQRADGEYRFLGVYDVDPGEIVEGPTSDGSESAIVVYARSLESEADKIFYATGGAGDRLTFDGEDVHLTAAPECRTLDRDIRLTSEQMAGWYKAEQVGFSKPYYVSPDGRYSFHLIGGTFSEEKTRSLAQPDSEQLEDVLAAVSSKGSRLSEKNLERIRLEQRREESQERLTLMLENWKDKQFPYTMEIKSTNGDDNTTPGVEIASVSSETFMGDPNPLRGGDVILSIGGVDVWGWHDVHYYLWHHGTDINRGIEKPFPVTVLRNGYVSTYPMTYAFNPHAFPKVVADKGKAFMHGLLDSVAFTLDDEILGWAASDSDYEKDLKTWQLRQVKRMRQQFLPDQFKTGSYIGMLSGPLTAATKGVAKFGGKQMAQSSRSMAFHVTADVLQGATYVAMSSSPLRTADMVVEDMKNSIPSSVATGIATRSLSMAFR